MRSKVKASDQGIRVEIKGLLASAKDVEDLAVALWKAKDEVFGESDVDDGEEFTINVKRMENTGKVMVKIGSDDPDLVYWMGACEYFLDTVAKMVDLPYEAALKFLCSGAKLYRNVD